MRMRNSHSSILFFIVVVFGHILLFCTRPTTCFSEPSKSSRDLLFEEKARLGSTPPSCHNKCNECHPCMAVQVPTIPSHDRVKPSSTEFKPLFEFSDSLPTGSRYSNYKPLGWKCRCGNHFFNP